MRERYLRKGFTFRIAKYFKAADTIRLDGWYRYGGGGIRFFHFAGGYKCLLAGGKMKE